VRSRSTIRTAALVYGGEPELDDPAEAFHAASKLWPSTALHDARGARALDASPALQEAAGRAVRRHSQRRLVALPAPALPSTPFCDLVAARRSERDLSGTAPTLAELAAVLFAAHGVRPNGRRPAPSGGGLYPLELHVAVTREGGPEPGLYHYDPSRHVLEIVRLGPVEKQVREAVPPAPADLAGPVLVFVTGVLWRTRFKYGLRGFRFALLEAGHVGQNLVLACAALGLPAVPVGAYFDGLVEELFGLDGVDETVLHAVAVGRSPEA